MDLRRVKSGQIQNRTRGLKFLPGTSFAELFKQSKADRVRGHSGFVSRDRGGIMVDALVFNPSVSLDFQDIRQNVIRVPEVMARLRQAQDIWDRHSSYALDLTNFISGEDSYFLSNIRLKSLAGAIVQVGLQDRTKKLGVRPKFYFGCTNGDSALRVAVGEITFAELVLNSSALSPSRGGKAPVGAGGAGSTTRNLSGGSFTIETLPVLTGISLSEYGCYEDKGEAIVLRSGGEMDMRRLIESKLAEGSIKEVMVIGPGDEVVRPLAAEVGGVKVLDSVESDPFLSWFWPHIRSEQSAQ